jgi:hypothetical protein
MFSMFNVHMSSFEAARCRACASPMVALRAMFVNDAAPKAPPKMTDDN